MNSIEAKSQVALSAVDKAGASPQILVSSSVERLAIYLHRIEQERALNAYWHLEANLAMQSARASDLRHTENQALSVIDGLIIGVKDNIDVQDMPCTAGMATRRKQVATQDAQVVAKLRANGSVLLGKLSLHEGALGADNNNPHYGACHNPHRFGYTPGGSSGGSAAAVAAGLCDLSLGTDTMGSVRIPASYCGVIGFKPSFGRYPHQGLVPACARLDHVGLLAKEFATIRAVDQVLAAPGRLAQGYAKPVAAGFLSIEAALGIDPQVQVVFNQAMEKLRVDFALKTVHLGAYADGVFGKDRRAGLLVTEVEMAQYYASDLAANPQLFSAELLAMLRFGQSKSSAELQTAHERIDAAALRAVAIFERNEIDVLMTPTTPQTAFAFGQAVPVNQADLTSMANFAGLPAISIPMGSIDGLPIGLQLIGRKDSDLALLEFAEQISLALRA
jgi:Asp-tRNA(Asn)/Glu-tRNA(Gln) amidotransferase A subunit family amidase